MSQLCLQVHQTTNVFFRTVVNHLPNISGYWKAIRRGAFCVWQWNVGGFVPLGHFHVLVFAGQNTAFVTQFGAMMVPLESLGSHGTRAQTCTHNVFYLCTLAGTRQNK